MRQVYLSLLRDELRRRRTRNPQYSLRAYAAFLGLDSSALSRVFNGKEDLSVKAAARVVRKLNLSAADQERFIVSIARARYQRTLADLSRGNDAMNRATALRAGEEHFRVMFESMDQYVTLCELIRDERGQAIDYVFLRVNPAVNASLDLIGHRALERYPNLERHWLDLYERVVDRRTPERAEMFCADLNGWFEVHVEATVEDRFIILTRDVTERKQREDGLLDQARQLCTTVNLMPSLLWITDADARSIWCNQRWCDYTGQTPTAAFDHGWTEAIHPEDRRRVTETYAGAVRAGGHFLIHHRLGAADGRFRNFLTRGEPIFNQTEQTWQVYSSSLDVEDFSGRGAE